MMVRVSSDARGTKKELRALLGAKGELGKEEGKV